MQEEHKSQKSNFTGNEVNVSRPLVRFSETFISSIIGTSKTLYEINIEFATPKDQKRNGLKLLLIVLD